MIRRPERNRPLRREMLLRSHQYLTIGLWSLRFSKGYPLCILHRSLAGNVSHRTVGLRQVKPLVQHPHSL